MSTTRQDRVTLALEASRRQDARIARDARAVKLAAEGLSCPEIAERMGLAAQTVRTRLMRLGVSVRKGKKTDLPRGLP